MAQSGSGGFAEVRSLLTVRPSSTEPETDLGSAPADALIIDFTEATERRTDRQARAERVTRFVTRVRARAYRPLLLIRIGTLDDESTDQDLDAVMPSRPDGIILAAAEDGAAIQRLGVKLSVREATLSIPDRSTAVMAECGSGAIGLLSLRSFAGASPRLAGLMWDAGALARACGGLPDAFEDDGPRSVVRTSIMLGASAAGVPAFDTAVSAQGDAVARDCRAARRLGYSGKVATAPAQVAVINAVFARQARATVRT